MDLSQLTFSTKESHFCSLLANTIQRGRSEAPGVGGGGGRDSHTKMTGCSSSRFRV